MSNIHHDEKPTPKLIQDLGLQYATSLNKGKRARYGMYECPVCLKPYRSKSWHILKGNSTKCKDCNHKTPTTYKHGDTKTRLHSIWRGMKDRCYRENNANYFRYGGKGITVCDEWLNDYVAFKEWSELNGYDKALTIDRINNDESYGPDNCRWVDMTIQCNNQSTSLFKRIGCIGFNKIKSKYQPRVYTQGRLAKEYSTNIVSIRKIIRGDFDDLCRN